MPMDEAQIYAALGMAWIIAWAVIVVVVWHLRSRRRERKLQMIHEERLRSIEQGTPLAEMHPLEDNGQESRMMNPRWPLGFGAIVASTGVGVLVAFMLTPFLRELWPLGLIGVYTGLGFILHYFLTRRKK